jgi:hypothetical protein
MSFTNKIHKHPRPWGPFSSLRRHRRALEAPGFYRAYARRLTSIVASNNSYNPLTLANARQATIDDGRQARAAEQQARRAARQAAEQELHAALARTGGILVGHFRSTP